MKRITLPGVLLALASLAPHTVCLAHGGKYNPPPSQPPPRPPKPGATGAGGTYSGPGDTAPGRRPSTPGPSGPSSPGPAAGNPGAGGSGPASPRSPAPPAGTPKGEPGRAETPSSSDPGMDWALWDHWWRFNKDPYLKLKSRVHGNGVLTGSDEFFLGQGDQLQAQDRLRPGQAQVRGLVVPALLAALERERSNEILTGALIALAKIGDGPERGADSSLATSFLPFLQSSSQEISETAAVSLGILASEASVPTLLCLMNDTREGRRLVGNRSEVPYRTRAFAAYGLGLVGTTSESNALRSEIASALIEVLNSPRFSTRDIKVAAMTALGLTAVDPAPDPALLSARCESEAARAGCCLQAQIAFLVDYLDPTQERKQRATRDDLVRAHAPTALARLLARVPEPRATELKTEVFASLRALVGQHSRAPDLVQQGVAMTFGMIADADADEVDVAMRAELTRLVRDGDRQCRRYALLSLARAGSRLGSGELPSSGVEQARAELLEQLARGRTLKPWAALGLGLMGHALLEQHLALDPAASLALRQATIEMKRPADAGAYCLALGLRKDLEGSRILLEKLRFFLGSDSARGYAAVALGLLGERGAIAPLQELIAHSKYRPFLMRQASIGLGLLGDKELVPELVARLREAQGLASQAALSSALGMIGDSRSIDPLVGLLRDASVTDRARAFAAVALGIVCDKEALPWNSKLSSDSNYRANPVTLTDESGMGILDIL